MSVKDIIKLACVFLNKQELIETNVFDETLREPTEEEQKEVEMLLRCLNLIVGEISCDYLPLINQENVTVSNKTIEFPTLSLTLLEVLSVRDKFGKLVKFKLFPNRIELPNGEYLVEYSYIPDSLTLDDQMYSFYGKVPDRVFAYGIAMEYSLLSSLFDEMEIWQTRFRDALKIAVTKHGEKRLPKRGWF